MPVTFTVDLEDPYEEYAADGRHIALTHRLLDLCDEYQCKATFFTVGLLATSAPDLIRQIASRGHEIAYHSHAHCFLTDETRQRFEAESRDDKDKMEQIIGAAVAGFRAPAFSVTRQNLWTLDVIQSLGFCYSSSIMPTKVSRFGIADAPHTPFRWPNGLIEYPMPLGDIMGLQVPYLGGIYLYALPRILTRMFLHQAKKNEALWTYTHPYDLDVMEPYRPMAHTPLWANMILRAARPLAERKLRWVMAQGTAKPLGQLDPKMLAVFNP